MKLLGPVLCALLLSAAMPAFADISRDDAAAAARQVQPGRVLSVERVGNTWRVKIVTARGEVKVVLVDATTGRAS